MKTAEEILNEHALTMFPTTWTGVVASCIYEAMRDYGKQCAEQALKEAANIETTIHGITICFSLLEQEAILSTPILTP